MALSLDLQSHIDALIRFYRSYKRIPTIREMAPLFKVTGMKSIYLVLHQLLDLGYMQKDNHGRQAGPKLLGYPIYESVSAGVLSPVADTPTQELNLDDYLVDKPQTTFFVKVQWESMKDAGLLPDDYVIVDGSRKSPRDGEIVIAVMDDGLTVKTFRKQGKKVRLQPENPAYSIIEPEGELSIQWVVIGSFRKF